LRRRITFTDAAKVGCLLALIGYCIFGVVALVRRGGESRHAGTCMSNMIQVYRGMRMHALRHQGALPDGESWADTLVRYKLIPGEDVLHCPKAPGRYGYAMNSRLGGANCERLAEPAERVLLFESTSDLRNAHDSLESVPDPPRHPRGNHYIFVDGHGGPLEEVAEVGDENQTPEAPAEGDETGEG